MDLVGFLNILTVMKKCGNSVLIISCGLTERQTETEAPLLGTKLCGQHSERTEYSTIILTASVWC